MRSGILGGYVGACKGHEVVDVVAGVEEEPAHGGIRDFVVYQRNGAHVQPDELLDIFQFLVQREFERCEYLGDHLGAHHVMAVEGPAQLGIVFLDYRLAHVVQQGGPAQP